jgi:hypothetical protein
MSRRRLALGGVLVVAALAGSGPAGCGGSDSEQIEPIELADGEVEALVAAPCPPRYEVLRGATHPDAVVAAAKRGRFAINNERVTLRPPIDWNYNPIEARSFAHTLFKFQWIDPLLDAYRSRGDVGALRQARDLVLDFARANPPEGEPVHENIWDDKRTGDRGPYLAFVLRAAECEGLLDDAERELLLKLMVRHANTLTDPDGYKPTNHGLFVDLGLTLLARQLDVLPESEQWAELGRERFAGTLLDRVVADEGFWLEHSAGYQILISRTLARFLEVPGNETPELADLLRRMQDVVGWLRAPDGHIPQLGDSDLKRVPKFADVRARDDRGILDLRESGLAIAKGEVPGRGPGREGYLAVMASYFSDAHKHADALTFDLHDRGRRLITDTGLYHKDKDENFAFAHATRAHSVLVVDGEEFPRDGTGTYGSGITRTGKGHGFMAILGENPAVADQGVEHRRLFVYEPGRVLVIVDRVRSDERHRYARFLQFAPGVEVRKRGRGLVLGAPGFVGAVTTNAAGGERIQLAEGEPNPLRGMTSPSFRRWVPRTTARLRSEGTDLDLITTMTLDGRPLRTELQSWDEGRIRLNLLAGDEVYRRLEVADGPDDDFEIGFVRRADR